MASCSGTPREKSAEDLEWRRLEAALLARCRGDSARARGLVFADSFEAAKVGLSETAEAMALLAAGEPLPLDGVRDVRAHLQRLERQGDLDGPAMADLASLLRVGRVLDAFLGARRQSAPALREACGVDPSLHELEEEIGHAIAPDGTVLDRASAELRRLREEVNNLRSRIEGRLEELMQQYEAVLQDRYYTIREGRFVVPVRRDAHERVPGIVHGTSASGASVFVEPRPIVALGNRFKMAQGELEAEVTRVLAALSERVRERIYELRACVEAVDHADLRQACAQLGAELDAVVPVLVNEPRLRLIEARHPLLVLEGGRVVPHRLELGGGQGLVISGPNAGGKTVALKTLGMAAWMVRVGMPVPAGEGSECGFFGDVLTDVGDEQSTASNLSTFSAHMTNISSIVGQAQRGSLVLLDELAGGTDPEEGAALACAIVEALCDAGAAVAVTTHYEPLKAMALRDGRLRNASVGFDVEHMLPTFELLLDVPGASSALVVAQRFGIGEAIIATARKALPEQGVAFERQVRELGQLAAQLQQERRELAGERAALHHGQQALEAARREVEARRQELEHASRQRLTQEVEALIARVRTARHQVADAQGMLQRDKSSAQAVAQAERLVNQVAEQVAVGGEVDMLAHASRDQQRSGAPARVVVGQRVYVPRLRAEGSIIEGPRKSRVRLAVGAMKLWVDVAELRAPQPGAVATAGAHPPAVEAPSPASAHAPSLAAVTAPRTEDNTLDLRGMRVDDALSLLETFVDRLYGQAAQVGYVLHGHGSGALRDAVRARLVDLGRYVSRSRAGQREEGGDAISVFYLAS